MQRDRLTDEFSTALKNFQTIQRTAAEKERASVNRARAQSGSFAKVLYTNYSYSRLGHRKSVVQIMCN